MSQLISVGQLFSQTWEEYVRDWKITVKISSWLFIPPVLSTALNLFVAWGTQHIQQASPVALLTGGAIFFLIGSALQVLGFILAIITPLRLTRFILAKDLDVNAEKKDPKILSWPWSWFGSFLWVLVLLILIVLAPYLLLIPGALASNFRGLNSFQNILTGLVPLFISFLVAVVISTWLSYKYTFASYLLLEDDKHGSGAISASAQLVKNHWWAVFGRGTVAGLIYGVIMMILFGLAFGMAGVVMFKNISAGASPYQQNGLLRIFILLPSLVQIFIFPWLITWHVKIFHSLKRL